MFGWFRTLKAQVAPLTVIAQELTAIRELYEAELLARDKPVWRITEKPGNNDTEVTYTDVRPEKPKSAMERAKEIVLGLQEDDDDESYQDGTLP